MKLLEDRCYKYLARENPTSPRLEKLKEEFRKNLQRWQEAKAKLESPSLENTKSAIKELNDANKKIVELKNEINEERAALN